MCEDVVDLRQFYDTSLGQVARRMIRRRLRALWPDVHGQSVLGLGFAMPYLRPFQAKLASLRTDAWHGGSLQTRPTPLLSPNL